jgi:hypothetical protein
MRRKDQCCGNCNAFMVDKLRMPNPPSAGGPLQGFCRAQPATAMQTMMQVNSPIEMERRMAQAVQGILLPSAATGWCREWEPEGHNRWHNDGDERP